MVDSRETAIRHELYRICRQTPSTTASSWPTTSSCTSDTWTMWIADSIWQTWAVSNNGTTLTRITQSTSGNYLSRAETSEERERRVQRELRHAEEARRIERLRRQDAAARRRADERAEELLHAFLSDQQKQSLQARGHFDITVHSKDGTVRYYRIKRGRMHNVLLLDAQGREPVQELCFHIGKNVPNADNMLAQMLALQANEDDARKIANIWDLRDNRRLIHQSAA